MPRYMCSADCYHNHHFYYKGDIAEFADDKKAGPHFVGIKSAKEAQTEKRDEMIAELKGELKELEKDKNPHPAHRARMEEIKEKLKELKSSKKDGADKE